MSSQSWQARDFHNLPAHGSLVKKAPVAADGPTVGSWGAEMRLLARSIRNTGGIKSSVWASALLFKKRRALNLPLQK